MSANARQVDVEKIIEILNNYPGEKHYILAMMQDVQREFKYLPPGRYGG